MSQGDQYVYRDQKVVIAYNVLHVFDPDMTIAMGLVNSAYRQTETQERDVLPNILLVWLRMAIYWISMFYLISCVGVFILGFVLWGLHVLNDDWETIRVMIVPGFFGALVCFFVCRITRRKTHQSHTYHLMVVANGATSSVLTSDDASYIDRLVNLLKQVKGSDWQDPNSTPAGRSQSPKGLP